MSIDPAEFQSLEQELAQGGVTAALERLVQRLRENQQYHELFEALKMQLRHRLELPLLPSEDDDPVDDAVRQPLEEGLLDACRQVGRLLLERGSIREGWMYWRPLGERAEAAELLARIEPDSDNLDQLIEVLLREGVDPVKGFQLVLEHYGTCNAITTLEAEIYQRPTSSLPAMISQLLRHVHRELLESVRADITRNEQVAPSESTLQDLVVDRDWMFNEYSYHLDTTHLASTVRFARRVQDPADLQLALDLTHYGRRLHHQFQYQGDPPFGELYPSHALYFQSLLGDNVEEAIDYFRRQAESLDRSEVGTVAVETYIDLLARLGRPEAAIEAADSMLPPGSQLLGIAPTLFELSERANSFAAFLQRCRQQGDLLGYATGLILAR